MKKLKGKTQIKGGKFYDSKGNQFITLQDAMANDTNCGCGINCRLGFVSLPNYNPESGDKDGYTGFYIKDGELVVDTVTNIRNEINNFCNGGGDGGGTQPLRLVFITTEEANLLVGDASDVNDWNNFFDLPTYGTPFTSVNIIGGGTIELFGGSNIVLRDYLFDYDRNASLLEFNDLAGCVISSGYFVFGGWDYSACINLSTLILPSIIDAKNFQELSSLTIFSAPLLEILGDNSPNGFGLFLCSSLTTINLPSLITIGNYCFNGCTSLISINIPSCTSLGPTIGDNNVFDSITGNTITLTIPAALMTANSGSPDGDIAYLQANNTVTVITV